jgi:hypothetical protein
MDNSVLGVGTDQIWGEHWTVRQALPCIPGAGPGETPVLIGWSIGVVSRCRSGSRLRSRPALDRPKGIGPGTRPRRCVERLVLGSRSPQWVARLRRAGTVSNTRSVDYPVNCVRKIPTGGAFTREVRFVLLTACPSDRQCARSLTAALPRGISSRFSSSSRFRPQLRDGESTGPSSTHPAVAFRGRPAPLARTGGHATPAGEQARWRHSPNVRVQIRSGRSDRPVLGASTPGRGDGKDRADPGRARLAGRES